jgi:lysozyme
MPKINPAGLNLIKTFEGCSLKAYRDPVGIWTIGYGHTGTDVREGQAITQQQADDLLARDLARFESGVNGLVSHSISPNQFAALVSFAFNLGMGALQESTLMRLVNAGDYAGAKAQFGRWVNAGGRTLEGLVRRRAAEAKLFSTP